MGQPNQLTQIAFAGGIDESQPDEVLDPSTAFLVMENGRQELSGGYAKRLGFAAMSNARTDGTTRSAGARMFAAGQQICVIDGTTLDSYSATTGRWASKGPVPEASQQPVPVPSLGTSSSTLTDVASLNGYTVLAWSAVAASGFSYPYLSVIDAATGAIIRNPEIKGSSAATLTVKLATYSSYVIAAVCNQVSNSIAAFYLDTTSAATISTGWVSIGSVSTDLGVGAIVNAVSLTGNAAIAIAYTNNVGGASQITVKTITIAGVGTTATLNTGGATPDFSVIGMVEGGSTLWIAWGETGVVKGQGLDATNISSTVATKQTVCNVSAGGSITDIRISPMGSGNGAVYVTTITNLYVQAIKVNAGATATNGSLALIGNSKMVSRPILRNSKIYGHFTSKNATELVLCECTPDTTGVAVSMYLRPVAVPIQRELFSSGGDRISAVNSTQYLYGYMVRKSGTLNGSAATLYDFASPYRWRSATSNGTPYLSGGVTSVFDGTRVFEAAFLCVPNKVNVTSTASAGAITFTNGGRVYVATYSDIDANGCSHVSGVSLPSSATGNIAAKLINSALSPLAMTARATVSGSPLIYGSISAAQKILVWGTTDGGNPPYYLVGEATNDPGSASVAFVDNVTDATLITQPLLYGTGNLPGTNSAGQDHRAPPGLLYITSYNGMLVGASGSVIYYSSQPIDGEGQWFSPVFSVPLEDTITALEVQDGTLYAFTRRSVFALSGDAPSDNAAVGGLGSPRKLASDVGCTNANSSVVSSPGITFQSERGLELLNRSGSVDYFGSQVRRTVASYPVVTAVVRDRLHGILRISLATAQTNGVVSGNGRDVVYDLKTNQWVSVDRKFGVGADEAAQDAAIVYLNGVYRYAWLGANGTVYTERDTTDGSAYLDGSTWITRAVETAKFKAAGIQGRQHFNRLLLLERYSTDHDESVALTYNYESTYRTARTWASTEIAALLAAGWPITQLKHDPHNDGEPCQGVGIRIADATPTGGTVGNGRGATLLALTLDLTPKPGAFEVPEGAA